MTPSNDEPLDDCEELIACLNAHGVEYVIIGAYAVGFHGYIRATSDMDLAVNPAPPNAAKLAAALKDFAGVEIDPADIKEKTRLELGRDPNSVDIITTMKGLAGNAHGRCGPPATSARRPRRSSPGNASSGTSSRPAASAITSI